MSDTELRHGLEEALQREIVVVRRHPHAYATSAPLEDVDVELADGTHVELVVKARGGAGVTPSFVDDPSREADVYRQILAPRDLGPRLYASGEDWVALERVQGDPLWQSGDVEQWCSVATAVRRLHDACRDARVPSLVRYDADYFRRFLDRARYRAPERVVARFDNVLDRIAALPQVLVHGQLYPSNVILASERIVMVDWETAGVGPRELDVAALATGWPDDTRERLVTAYGDVSVADVDACAILLAVQWLGWSRDWTPPREHKRNWEAEALAAAERLGL